MSLNDIVQTAEKSQVFATVKGEPVTELPKNLYIPPEALEVYLEQFEGPLDLLLFLIRKQDIDILNIPVNEITNQYVSYIELMQILNFELAAEYLVMAAMLAEIKSRMMLPSVVEEEEDEEDPRAELVRRLQEYEKVKFASIELDDMERVGRDVFIASANIDHLCFDQPKPQVDIGDLTHALLSVMARKKQRKPHTVEAIKFSITDRMNNVMNSLREFDFIRFQDCFTEEEGRAGLVVAFSAILQLLRNSLIEITQEKPLYPIFISLAKNKTKDSQS